MNAVIIPLNAFPSEEVLAKGQASYVECVAKNGAYGIEIRRELFPEGEFTLEEIKKEVTKHKLVSVYSAPIKLWKENGQLNKGTLQKIVEEAIVLEANWVKVSLGHFQEGVSDCLELKKFLKAYSRIQLFIENDQTMYGGNVENLTSFFKRANHQNVPVKMTFDTGNWYYTNQDVEHAIDTLADYVSYIHFKHVVKQVDGYVTVPLPTKQDAEWRQILRRFPTGLMKALEFPMEIDEMKLNIELVEEAVN